MSNEMLIYDKVAIFDLDGTLWHENSHTYLVDQYYKIHGIKKICFKIYGRIFPQKNMDKLNMLFEQIPLEYIDNFCPTINVEIVDKLNKYNSDGWEVMIITNAPQQITQIAEKIFNVKVYKAKIACKSKYLSNMKTGCLHVISDNKTDIDIINQADQAFVLTDKSNQSFFKRYKNTKIKLIKKSTLKRKPLYEYRK